jgi:hypothetical protein
MAITTKASNGQLQEARSLLGQFNAARRCGTPLVAIQTADTCATIQRVSGAYNKSEKIGCIQWDVVRGFMALDEVGKGRMAEMLAKSGMNPEDCSGTVVVCCKVATDMPQDTLLFIHNAQRHMENIGEIQSMCNLRDTFKSNRRMLVLVGPQMKLPVELQTDVVTLDEPLPGKEELAKIVKDTHRAASAECPPEQVYLAVEAIQGLPAFAAEQVTAMSLYASEPGNAKSVMLDVDGLWEKKRRQIEQTPGLSVSREGIKFDDLGGLPVVKQYLRDLLKGESKPQSVVFIDEIEKMIAGQGDTSGVSQDQLQALLTYMQDNRCPGVLMVGHPGSGKSATAKATGNEAGVPTIQLDLGSAKGSLVGQSEQQLRTALKVITAVSNGSSLWIATCNSLASLPPELRRRFKCGVFFFDLPDAKEREAIWKVQRQRFSIKASDKQPADEGWTGAEIESCCELAWRLKRPLLHAANFVVPISQSAPDRVEALRQQADQKWLSASHVGVYRKAQDAVSVAKPMDRKLDITGEDE